jgi:AcrR family transcriptional regulator
VDAPAPVTRRPRDRRDQIATKASELFAERGYQSVRMDDIAEASGITARAIYRHYENKQALLSHVVLGEQSPLIELVEEWAKSPPDARDLDERLVTLTEVCLDNPRLSLLWQREARHLNPEDFKLLRGRTRMLAREYDRLLVRPERSDLDDYAALLRALTVASITSSSVYFDRTLPRPRLVRELVDATERGVLSDPAEPPADRPAPTARRSLGSRREQLIAAAASAFRRDGYAGVSIDEIGREVGVVGPALYRYFDNKADILVAAVTRFSEWRALELLRALEEEPRDDRVIVGLIGRYIHLAVEAPDLVAVSLTERLFLPENVRDRFDRAQSENLAEWQRWLLEARPDLDPQLAAILATVAKTIIDDCVRTPRLQGDPRFEGELGAVVRAVLGLGQS